MENVFIDSEELNQFILKKAKNKGYELTEEIIELVLNLEMEFLDSKGLITESEN